MSVLMTQCHIIRAHLVPQIDILSSNLLDYLVEKMLY